jgi:hypothetical protein
VLIASSFAKMLTYWISEETGMVGGLFYPMLLIGSMCGRVIVNEFGTSWATTLACSLVALPAAICPVIDVGYIYVQPVFKRRYSGSSMYCYCPCSVCWTWYTSKVNEQSNKEDSMMLYGIEEKEYPWLVSNDNEKA